MLARFAEYELTPTTPVVGYLAQHPGPTLLKTDMHQAFELGIVLAGEHERRYEDTEMVLGPGDVWLCSAWEPHGWRIRNSGGSEVVFMFLSEFLGEETLAGKSWLTIFSPPPSRRPRAVTPGMRKRLLEIAEDLQTEIQGKRRGWESALRLDILRVLLTVSRDWWPAHASGRQRAVRTTRLDQLMPVLRLVHSNPVRHLGVSEAAAACGLSVSQFSYVFRHTLGLTFSTFCTRIRLWRVAQLLLGTDLTIGAIAEQAGFVDGSHLHRVFLRVYGCTPARYRAEGQRVATTPDPAL